MLTRLIVHWRLFGDQMVTCRVHNLFFCFELNRDISQKLASCVQLGHEEIKSNKFDQLKIVFEESVRF